MRANHVQLRSRAAVAILLAVTIISAAALAWANGHAGKDSSSTTINRALDGDCNSNGIIDEDELIAGSATDCNGNGVLDICDLTHPRERLLEFTPVPGLNAYGASLAVDGDWAAFPDVLNGIHLFRWNGYDWIENESEPPNGSDGIYGAGLALSEDVLAYSKYVAGSLRGGPESWLIYIVRRNGNSWEYETQFEHPERQPYFGYNLDLDGDRLFTTVRDCDNPQDCLGEVLAYRDYPSGWDLEHRFRITDAEWASLVYVAPIAVDGDLMAVGTSPASGSGSPDVPVYIFRRHPMPNGAQRWLQEDRLIVPRPYNDLSQQDLSLALEHDVLVVGRPTGDEGENVLVFRRRTVAGSGAHEWLEETRLIGNRKVAICRGRIMTALVKLEFSGSAGGNSTNSIELNLYRNARSADPVWELRSKFAPDLLVFGRSSRNPVAIADTTLLASFAGEVYVVDRIEDCNSNGVPDSCDIDSLASTDCNSNAIPDECETPCEALGIGVEDGPRLAALFADCQTVSCATEFCDPPLYAGSCCTLLDADADGDVDLLDYAVQQRCILSPVELDCNGNAIGDHLESVLADFDGDGFTTPADFDAMHHCLSPICLDAACDPPIYGDPCCLIADSDHDGDIDLIDFATFEALASGV